MSLMNLFQLAVSLLCYYVPNVTFYETLITHFLLSLNFTYVVLSQFEVDLCFIANLFSFIKNLKVFEFMFRFRLVIIAFLHPIHFKFLRPWSLIDFKDLQVLIFWLYFILLHFKVLFFHSNVSLEFLQSS